MKHYVETYLKWICITFLLHSCSSMKKLDSSQVVQNHRVIFGKLVGANPDTKDLRLTYILKEKDDSNFLALDNQFPYVDAEAGYFWIVVPQNTSYFGVRSIHFTKKGTGGVAAVLRDEQNNRALFGTKINPGNAPVYVGDIFVAAAVKTGHNLDSNFIPAARIGVDYIKIVQSSLRAKEFISDRGLKSAPMADSILKNVSY